ncbi:MAG: hypothetical protein KDB05_17010, partial [Planctomycetales bacterium]|nr:hypothetical protein [Planctomycetales bacterium]
LIFGGSRTASRGRQRELGPVVDSYSPPPPVVEKRCGEEVNDAGDAANDLGDQVGLARPALDLIGALLPDALGCGAGIGSALGTALGGGGAPSAWDAANTAASCALALANLSYPVAIPLKLLGIANKGIKAGNFGLALLGAEPYSPNTLSARQGEGEGEQTNDPRTRLAEASQEVLDQARRIQAMLAQISYIYGSPEFLASESSALLKNWLDLVNGLSFSPDNEMVAISSTELSLLRDSSLRPSMLTDEQLDRFAERWNRSVEYYARGVFTQSDLNEGENGDFIDLAEFQATIDAATAAQEEIVQMGYANAVDAMTAAHANLVTQLNSLSDDGTCAEIRLQISQDVIQTRSAFLAEFGLNNEMSVPVEMVEAEIFVLDANGVDRTSLFGITKPLSNGSVLFDGTDSVPALSEATTQWLIVPSEDAAPNGDTVYFVGGFVTYQELEIDVRHDFLPALITVKPQPALDLDYFLQRDVISDDPFTDEIEPAEIFTLGVQVQNRGVGTAKDLRIESAQPKIIENEKGLLIDFEIVGTSVNGEPAERTLTALIGDLPGGELAIAEWQLESTLQGLFTEYEASFEHISDFGSPELSLIKSVEIHELIRAVQATASGIDDSLTDFLVNDIPDPQDSPDSLYLSDGSVVDVQLGSNGQFDSPASFSNLVVNVTASMPTGWAYVNLTDPSDGEFQLVGVRRSDGTMLDPSNFWQTDRTFIGLGLRPLYENKVHLLDFDSTGNYEFIYSNGDLTGPGVERFAGVDPNPTARALGHIDVRFDELIDPASLDISDVTLLKNGVAVPTAGITVLTGSNPLVRIGGLGTLTEEDAVYELQVDLAGVRDFVGNRGEGLESIIWVKGEAAPAVIALTGLPDEFSTSPISTFQLRVTEPVQLASILGAVSLLHDGVSVDVSGASVNEVESGLYEISGLESLTSTDGDYELTLDATALLDLDGNAGIGQRSHAWQLDATPPRIIAVFAPPTNPRNIVVQRVDVEFSEAIDPSSLTVDDVMLIRDGGTENLLAGEGRVTIEDRGNNIYRIGGINWVQAFIADPQIADFTFSIDAAAVRDLAGNAGIGSESTTWTIDLVSPVAPENLAVAVEELPEGAGEESPNAVFSGTALESDLTLVIENEFTGDELFRGPLTDTNFSIPLRLPAEGRNELSGRVIDIAGNTTDFDLPNAFTTSLPPIVTETTGFTPRIRRTTIDQFTLTFAKPVAADSFTADVLSLQRDGSDVGVPASIVIETSADRRMFTVSGLGDATFEEGEYRLSVDLRLLRGADGVRGTGIYTEAWTLDRTPPTTRVVSTLLESTTRRYFVSVESDAATLSPTEVSEFTIFAVSPNSPLARVARLDPETPGTEFEGDLDEEYVFFSDALDAAGNRQPLTLASTGGFPITLDAANQTELPNELIVAEGTAIQFSGNWSVELPEVADGVFRHRIKVSDRMLNVKTSTPWQNPVRAHDVNHNGMISPLDALIIINRLNSDGPRNLIAPTSLEGLTDFFYLDANGDHSVSPIDVLVIINLLNDRTGSGEGESPMFPFDPRFLATGIHSPMDLGPAQDDSVDVAIQSLTTGMIPQRETPVQGTGIVSDVEEKDLVAAIDEFFGNFVNDDPLTNI